MMKKISQFMVIYIVPSVLTGIVMLFLITSFIKPTLVRAQRPRSAKITYVISGLTVYCEEPNGNEIYVVGNAISGGPSVYVVPGGCK